MRTQRSHNEVDELRVQDIKDKSDEVQLGSVFRWRAALESAEQGVWEVNLTNQTQFHSDDWYKIRRFDPQDKCASGKDEWLARIHPDDIAKLLSEIENEHNLASHNVRREYREKNAWGEYQWILSRGRVFNDPTTGDKLAIGTDTVITETREAQSRLVDLTDTEQRWRIAVESACQGLWDINMSTGNNYFSDEWRNIRGLMSNEQEPPTSADWFDTIHPDDRERLKKEFDERNNSGSDVIRHEYRQRRKDGTWAWIMSRGKVVAREADQKIRRMIGTDTDITPVKEAEAKIRHLADRFDFAMLTSEVRVWEFDVEKQIYSFSSDMSDMFAMDSSTREISAEKWKECIHPEDLSRVLAACQYAITSKSRYDMDYRIVLANGATRHMRCRAAYRTAENGGSKLIGASWDVSADYALAEELRNAKNLAVQRANELEKTREKLEYSANYDALTGLCNRRNLDEQLKNLGSIENNGKRVALLHIDLDRFKEINDTLGHCAGDKVLMEVARILQNHAPQSALVARSGGDEFIILIENAPNEDALSELAGRLINRMKQPISIDGHECLYGASIGISCGIAGQIPSHQLLINADIALYSAKNAGRNQFSFFSTKTQKHLVDQKTMADAILRGLDRDEFFPVYQLQFDAQTLDITGVEALVRWQHPEKGEISPDNFVPVAEDINAISKIDDLVLRKGLADLATWDAMGMNIPKLSVNVSSRRIGDEKLMKRLSDLNIETGRVSFELLESIFLDNQNEIIATNLRRLRDFGIGIDIDDFGTGHASIACLLNLRPNKFKIDRSLVQPLLASVERRRLVASILDIGRALGIPVVAEGVETMDHAIALKKMECQFLQGYGLARPMKAQQLTAFVRNRAWLKAA